MTAIQMPSGMSPDQVYKWLSAHSCAFYASQYLSGPPEPPYNGRFLVAEHHEAWSRLTNESDRLCILAPRDHGKSYFFTLAYPIWMAEKHPGRYGMIFSGSQPQAERILNDIAAEVETNPRLKHLLPSKKTAWSSTKIRFANGHVIYARGYGTKVRGSHPVWIVCQPKGTQVLTKDGYVDVSKIKIGDQVWTHRGRWRPVTHVGKRKAPVRGYKIAGNLDVEWATDEHKFWDGQQFILPEKGDWIEAALPTDVVETDCTEAQAKLFGLFIGDGTLSEWQNGKYTRRGITLYVSRHEEEIDQIIRDAGYHPNWSDGSTCRRVLINSATLYEQCKQLKAEGNSQKRITFEMENWPKHLQRALVQGYWMADGCRSQAAGRSVEYKATSVAKPLLLSLQRILARLGVTSSVRLLRPAKTTQIEGREVNCQETYDIRCTWELGALFGWEEPPTRQVRNKRQYVLGDRLRRRIEFVEDRGETDVYSFTVAEDHSYTGHLVTTHNCDDVLNDEDGFSELKRTRNIDYFQTAITNMIVPGGQIVVVGTPFHQTDLYGMLENNEEYLFRRYQAITKEGRALWPDRYSIESLKKRQREIGRVKFARELQCNPVSDGSSLFPGSLFKGPDVLRDDIVVGHDWRWWQKNHGVQRFFMGVDFARSANVGADYTVLFVVGVDGMGNRWIIDIVRFKGLGFEDQLARIKQTAAKYNPDIIACESNQMQAIFGDELIRTTDLPIKNVHTGDEKHSLEKGIPALRVILENRKVRIPYGDERSREMSDIWIEEMRNHTFHQGKVQSVGEHDDTAMAWFICEKAIKSGMFSFSFGEQDGDEAAYMMEMGYMPMSPEEQIAAVVNDGAFQTGDPSLDAPIVGHVRKPGGHHRNKSRLIQPHELMDSDIAAHGWGQIRPSGPSGPRDIKDALDVGRAPKPSELLGGHWKH